MHFILLVYFYDFRQHKIMDYINSTQPYTYTVCYHAILLRFNISQTIFFKKRKNKKKKKEIIFFERLADNKMKKPPVKCRETMCHIILSNDFIFLRFYGFYYFSTMIVFIKMASEVFSVAITHTHTHFQIKTLYECN